MRLSSAVYFVFFALFLVAIPAFGIVIPACQTPGGVGTNQDCTAADYTAGGTVYNGIDSSVNLNGVVAVYAGNTGYGCSGVLISPTLVLTAAHCFNGTSGASAVITFQDFDTGQNQVIGTQQIGGTSIVDPVYASFVGPSDLAWETGADLAIVDLSTAAPSWTTAFQLYTGAVPYGATVDMAGWGYSGTGSTGEDFSYGTLRAGQNSYDTNGSLVYGPDVSSNLLMGDFDDGLSANNAFGGAGTDALGVPGGYEVDLGHGDSGGPTFYDGMLIGIHDIIDCSSIYSVGPCGPSNAPDSYYGEIFGDTSVASVGNANWIEAEIAAVPEPASWLLCLAAAPFVLERLRNRRR